MQIVLPYVVLLLKFRKRPGGRVDGGKICMIMVSRTPPPRHGLILICCHLTVENTIAFLDDTDIC